MASKKGGGNKYQLYDEENGEYCRNKQCVEDEKNLVLKILFGLETNKPIQYPIYGIHDLDYCDFIVKYCLNFNHPHISNDKLTKYLLIKKEKNDKSALLNKLGYNLSNSDELYNQILKGTNFKKRKLKDFDDAKFTINVETRIYDKSKNDYYYCTTSWFVEKDLTLRFVTLIPEVFKDDKD